jgi:N-acetylmuramoyl-L-alanine amidase
MMRPPTTRATALPALVAALLLACACPAPAAGPSARSAYERAQRQERALGASPSPGEVRRVAASYEAVAVRYENTGYADNALWRAGDLLSSLYARTRVAADRDRAMRRLRQLSAQYPASSLVPAAQARLKTLTRAASRGEPTRPARDKAARTAAARPPAMPTPPPSVPAPPSATPAAPALAQVVDVSRAVLPEVVRVTIELDREVRFTEDRLDDPPRVFFDITEATTRPHLDDAVLAFENEVVRHIRLGKRPGDTTRVVLDLDGASRYSVFSLYDPFRIVVDVQRPVTEAAPALSAPLLAARAPVDAGGLTGPAVAVAPGSAGSRRPLGDRVAAAASRNPPPPAARPAAGAPREPAIAADGPSPAAPEPDAERAARGSLESEDLPPLLPAPAAPATNANGSYSLARQLGLGVSRVVIDPGHGGRDPGAMSGKLSEADLVLDIALRLEKLLLAQPGVEVVLTRRTDVYVPLEERTAIANRERADLFLSIHANASRRKDARGIETYVLNFASTPEAEAVAARENSASRRDMRHLPDIVRAIALNNKLDESRDFAQKVQRALVASFGAKDQPRDLGVKQAPFVVLIGAQMPSILAEVSFITNPKDNQLLRTPAHRQRIAVALFEGVRQYQRSLKAVGTVANY